MSNYGDHNSESHDEWEERKKEATRIINDRYRDTPNKDIAREVAERTRILMTPKEVEDTHRGGW